MSVNLAHLADLSHLKLNPKESKKITGQLDSTLKAVAILKELNTAKIIGTPQVTGLTNRFRQDQIDLSRCLTPKAALSNALKTHNNYFVVPAVLTQ